MAWLFAGRAEAFNKGTVETSGKHGWSTDHFNYNQATRELSERFCRANDIKPNQMTSDQAKNLLKVIASSQDPRIRDFLTAITAPNIQQNGLTPMDLLTVEGFAAWALTYSAPAW